MVAASADFHLRRRDMPWMRRRLLESLSPDYFVIASLPPAFPSPARLSPDCRLDGRYVDLCHRHHRIKCPFGGNWVWAGEGSR
jgi:hypothetical protein